MYTLAKSPHPWGKELFVSILILWQGPTVAVHAAIVCIFAKTFMFTGFVSFILARLHGWYFPQHHMVLLTLFFFWH
jgi:hypothetical protein